MKNTKETILNELDMNYRLTERVQPKIVLSTMLIICSFFMLFLIWCCFATVDEITKAEGDIIPKGSLIRIQHYDGGIVEKINVYEGEHVTKGQVILELKSVNVKEDLKRAINKNFILSLQAERLRAFLQNRAPDYSIYDKKYNLIISRQKQIFNDMVKAKESEERLINNQIDQQQHLLKELLNQKITISDELELSKKIYEMRSSLNEQGYESELQILLEKRKVINLSGRYRSIIIDIGRSKKSIKEYQERLVTFRAKYRDKVNHDLEKIDSEISQNLEIIEKLKNAKLRLVIRAPEEGIIKSLSLNSVGQVVSPGQSIAELVPYGKELIAQVRIMPKDIGHITIGQPVKVKITSYDYIRYGIIHGEISYLSASTFTDENGNSYYRGRIHLKTNVMIVSNKKKFLIPGMRVQADILTGKKSVIAYLLKPILTTKQEALTER